MIAPKYRALFIFILFSLNNGFAWIMFDPVASWLAMNVKGMSVSQLQTLSSWQPLMFFLIFFPVMRAVVRPDGLRDAVRVAVVCEVIGALLKMIGVAARSSWCGVVFLNLGQICGAVGSPVATGCVSALSAGWFYPEERTRATAAAVLANTVGNALSYILVPAITKNAGFFSVTLYETLMAVVAAALAWLAFPAESDAEHMPVQGPHRDMRPVGRQLTQLLANHSVVLLLLIYSWSSGGFSAWVSLFDATYEDLFSDAFIGVMCFFGMLAYVIGGLASSYFTDLYFRRQMKSVILVCMACSCISSFLFAFSLHNDHRQEIHKLRRVWIVMLTSFCGFWNGFAAPLFYELIAEISYPVDEAVSGIAVSVCENLGAFVFYQVISRLCKGRSMTITYSFGMAFAAVFASAVQQRYNRSKYTYLITSDEIVESCVECSDIVIQSSD